MISPFTTIGIVTVPLLVNADVAVTVIVGIGDLPSDTAEIPVGHVIVPTVHGTCSLPHNAITCVVVVCVPFTEVVVPKNV